MCSTGRSTGPGAGRGRGRAPPRAPPVTVPNEDFNFEEMMKKFNKQAITQVSPFCQFPMLHGNYTIHCQAIQGCLGTLQASLDRNSMLCKGSTYTPNCQVFQGCLGVLQASLYRNLILCKQGHAAASRPASAPVCVIVAQNMDTPKKS